MSLCCHRLALQLVFTLVVVVWLPNLLASSASELQCPSCEKIHCSPRRASKLECRGGITTGICNCCPVCAKLEHERCGGDWNYLGKCDRGLVCEPENRAPIQLAEDLYTGAHRPTGICQKGPTQVGDEGLPSYCYPKCTPKFCKKKPKAICSAKNVAERHQSCHGQCQHTSCRACRFLQDEPDCGRCAKDDLHCLKRFGKCMRRAVCNRNIFPCRKSRNNGPGKFVCVVPGCDSFS
ncbi:insulin-like growth factor-binding protein 2 [Liolophura sinensis]|uniref:insulin-like growth factor-binding protein 2 n=1 Tax=Liolophura sinensis TaxID=3198878 RepID=UPI0031581D96